MSNINPDHYKNCSIECWDAMKIILGTNGFISFCIGNAFKYLWRYKYKNGMEDLEKANRYLKEAKELIDDDNYAMLEQVKNIEELYWGEVLAMKQKQQ